MALLLLLLAGALQKQYYINNKELIFEGRKIGPR